MMLHHNQLRGELQVDTLVDMLLKGIGKVISLLVDEKGAQREAKRKVRQLKVWQRRLLLFVTLLLLILPVATSIYFLSPFPATITKVSLNASSLEVTTGDTGTLSATVLYSNNATGSEVHWVSSNNAVIQIDEMGQFTAIAEGNAIITAQASNLKSFEQAECAVTVHDPLQGYRISVQRTAVDNYIYIYVQPYNTDVSQIKIFAKAPSGQVFSPKIDANHLYHFYSETGTWTVYASLTSEKGVYEAQKPEDFVTIEITDISATDIEAHLSGLPVF